MGKHHRDENDAAQNDPPPPLHQPEPWSGDTEYEIVEMVREETQYEVVEMVQISVETAWVGDTAYETVWESRAFDDDDQQHA